MLVDDETEGVSEDRLAASDGFLSTRRNVFSRNGGPVVYGDRVGELYEGEGGLGVDAEGTLRALRAVPEGPELR